jgi:hypothetical protein
VSLLVPRTVLSFRSEVDSDCTIRPQSRRRSRTDVCDEGAARGRLSPALKSSGLLPELIGICAEYAAHPLRWSATVRAPRALLSGRDDDRCSRVLVYEKYDSQRADHKDTTGWQSALSHEPLSTLPVDSDGRVRWGCRLDVRSGRCMRADVNLQPNMWGADDRA